MKAVALAPSRSERLGAKATRGLRRGFLRTFNYFNLQGRTFRSPLG
jgi:hypothetical protein